jgi:hypothetical protein
MAEVTLSTTTVRKPAEQVTPAATTTTDNYAVLSGSQLNAGPYNQASYIFKNTGSGSVGVGVYAANDEDYTQEIQVQSSAVTSGVVSAWSGVGGAAQFGWYRLKIKSTASGTHGSVSGYGLAR